MKLLGITTIPSPMSMILSQQDSLRLSRAQADSLATLSYRFAVFVDSVWTPVADILAALPMGTIAGMPMLVMCGRASARWTNCWPSSHWRSSAVALAATAAAAADLELSR
jgi:hypothetical protein